MVFTLHSSELLEQIKNKTNLEFIVLNQKIDSIKKRLH